MKTAEQVAPRDIPFLVPLVCPACRGELGEQGRAIICKTCRAQYPFENGFPDLIIGGRFEDGPRPDEEFAYEERFNAYTTEHYFIPLFRKLFAHLDRRPRLLSLGCGTGTDVDTLHEAGFDCVGIDCGNRASVWPRRTTKNTLLLANGKHLPFESETFDGVFCSCVFPHVGVEGDTYKVTPHFRADRFELAREMTRVLTPGGKILAASPNKLFPFDIYHGRAAGCYVPRPYSFRDPFLLSVGDYRQMFQRAGCKEVQAMPLLGYWGFLRSRESLKGYLLGMPFRFIFWLLSQPGMAAFRGSPLTPWIVVLGEKDSSEAA